MSMTRSPTKSHPLSLLSKPRLNSARSRTRLFICRWVRMAQISLAFNGAFCPTSFPLFQGQCLNVACACMLRSFLDGRRDRPPPWPRPPVAARSSLTQPHDRSRKLQKGTSSWAAIAVFYTAGHECLHVGALRTSMRPSGCRSLRPAWQRNLGRMTVARFNCRAPYAPAFPPPDAMTLYRRRATPMKMGHDSPLQIN